MLRFCFVLAGAVSLLLAAIEKKSYLLLAVCVVGMVYAGILGKRI